MTDELRAQIKQLIEVNGPMGVNAIQREVGIPLSTLQKYLDYKQNYFIKNDNRKWDLPESMAAELQITSTNNFESVITSNIASIRALMNSAMVQLEATLMLINANKSQSSSVAYSPKPMRNKEESNQPINKEGEIKPIASQIGKMLRMNRKTTLDTTYECLSNINWKLLEEEHTTQYLMDNIMPEFSEMVFGRQEYFSHSIYDVIEPYMK